MLSLVNINDLIDTKLKEIEKIVSYLMKQTRREYVPVILMT